MTAPALQPIESRAVYPRRFGARHAAACRSLKHPFRYCKAAVRRLNRLRAPKYPPVSPDQYLMHENAPTKPWMPGVENFSFLGPVGVMLSSCTIRRARTWRWARMRPWVGRSSGPVSLWPSQSCPGCTTNTSGSDFRKGQGARVEADTRTEPRQDCKPELTVEFQSLTPTRKWLRTESLSRCGTHSQNCTVDLWLLSFVNGCAPSEAHPRRRAGVSSGVRALMVDLHFAKF
jgi:hypothetical protein